MKVSCTLTLVVACLVASCSGLKTGQPYTAKRVEVLVDHLRNSDVQLHLTYVGLNAELSERAERIEQIGKPAVPALYTAVHRDHQFVVAHVLLTRIVSKKWSTDASTWNGLRIDWSTNGLLIVSSSNRVSVAEHWREELTRHGYSLSADRVVDVPRRQ